jgi:hypothetical protein
MMMVMMLMVTVMMIVTMLFLVQSECVEHKNSPSNSQRQGLPVVAGKGIDMRAYEHRTPIKCGGTNA